jgi:hypothetical protein
LDWTPNAGLNGFESERRSAVQGANGGLGIVSSERSLTTSLSMDGLKQLTPRSEAADRDANEEGLGAGYGAGETPESDGEGPNWDRRDCEHLSADGKQAGVDEQAGAPARLAESERAAYPLQETTPVKDWDLYIAEYPPDDEGSALRSEHDELYSTWSWDFGGADSERGSATVRTPTGVD